MLIWSRKSCLLTGQRCFEQLSVLPKNAHKHISRRYAALLEITSELWWINSVFCSDGETLVNGIPKNDKCNRSRSGWQINSLIYPQALICWHFEILGQLCTKSAHPISYLIHTLFCSLSKIYLIYCVYNN